MISRRKESNEQHWQQVSVYLPLSSCVMLLVWSLLSLFLSIHSSTSDQLCQDTCQYQYDTQTEFQLPISCTQIRRDRCSAVLNFDHVHQTVAIEFGSPLPKQVADITVETKTIVHTVINLEDTSFMHQTVEYYCSTGDSCDLDYVRMKAIPLFSRKQCDNFQKELMKYLHPNSTSLQRECFVSETTFARCDLPCDLLYSPDRIIRSCDGQVDLTFETSVGQSTPINLPEFRTRLFSYGCTGQFCNGQVMQGIIQKLIDSDQGQCLISLNETAVTSTSTFTTPSSSADYNQARACAFVSSVLIGFVLVFAFSLP